MKTILIIFTLLASSLNAKPICPMTKQNILLLDLKASSWSEDEAFFEKISQRLKESCPNLVEMETQSSTSIPEDFSKYTQVWILSGSEADKNVLRVDSVPFQELLKKIQQASANVFIGTGFGNIYHANPITQVMTFGTPFETEMPSESNPVLEKVVTQTWLEKGKHLLDHPLFEDLNKIPETVSVGGVEKKSDWLKPEAVTAFGAFAKNDAGKMVIAATCGCNGRTTFVDTGIQRWFPLLSDYPEIFEYIARVMALLQREN